MKGVSARLKATTLVSIV
ncbi:hypothetical protein LINPERPRIM_LOCUS14026 [Linum perenne]